MVLDRIIEERMKKGIKTSIGPKFPTQSKPNFQTASIFTDPLKFSSHSAPSHSVNDNIVVPKTGHDAPRAAMDCSHKTGQSATREAMNSSHNSANSSSASVENNNYWQLTKEEATKRRELGLCYRYDEKFSPNDRCKNKQFNVLIFSEENAELEDQ